jgi:hypothetical protein
MSDAAFNLFADLRIRRAALIADLQASRAEIQKALSGSGGGAGIALKIDTTNLAKQITEAIEKAFASAKINLGSGAMGGGAGGGGGFPQMFGQMTGGPYGRAALAAFHAAGVPLGGPGYALPGQLPGGAAMPGAGGGGYGFGGGFGRGGRNPFSVRGLAATLGPAFALAYAGNYALRIGEGLAEASAIENNPNRILRQEDSLSDPHDVMNDPVLQRNAASRARLEARERRERIVESTPFGMGSRIISSATDFEGRIGDERFTLNRQRDIYTRSLNEQDQASIGMAGLSNDPVAVARARAARQGRIDAKMVSEAASGPAEIGNAALDAQRANEKLSAGEIAQALARRRASISGIEGSALQYQIAGQVSESLMSGDTRQAMMTRQQGERFAQTGQFEQRRVGKSVYERQAIDVEEGKADEALRAKQKHEQQEFDREREADAAQTEDRITNVRSSAAEARTRAMGRHYEAEKAEFFRAQDNMVRKAQEAYDRETDIVAKGNAKRVLDATRLAATANKGSYDIGEGRARAREAGIIDDDTDVMNTRARGQNTRATRDQINQSYQRKIREAQEKGDPGLASALTAQYGAALAENDRDEARQRRRIQHGTTAANAEAAGQEGVGAALSLQDELSDLQKDAAGDPDRMQDVRRYGKARVDAMRRNIGVTRGRRGSYNDFMSDVQDAVLNQAKYGQANKMLDNVNSALAYNKPLDDANPDADRAMAQAARDISKAVDGKSLYVLRD